MSGAPQPTVELVDDMTDYVFVEGIDVDEDHVTPWLEALAARRERGELEIGDACTQLLERCNAEIAKIVGLPASLLEAP